MARIFVIDDDSNIVALLGATLASEGHEVRTPPDPERLLDTLKEYKPHLVILDLVLRGIDGLDVCRQIKRDSSVPIIILTALQDEVDKVVALELGADDYVTKPFSIKEFVARVRTLLRRFESPSWQSENIISGGGIAVDLRRWEATKDGRPLDLKNKEFELLVLLMRNRGRVLTRRAILQEIWAYNSAGQTRTVDVHVARLRRKIEDVPDRPTVIVSTRGTGYSFQG